MAIFRSTDASSLSNPSNCSDSSEFIHSFKESIEDSTFSTAPSSRNCRHSPNVFVESRRWIASRSRRTKWHCVSCHTQRKKIKKKKIWPVLFGFVAIWKSFLGVYLKFAWLKTAKNSESRKFSRKIVTTRRYFRTFWMLWCHARSEGDRGWRLIFLHLFDPFHIVHQNLF